MNMNAAGYINGVTDHLRERKIDEIYPLSHDKFCKEVLKKEILIIISKTEIFLKRKFFKELYRKCILLFTVMLAAHESILLA